MIDVTAEDDSEIRRIIGNMLDFIVQVGLQDRCTLEEFKSLLVDEIQASRAHDSDRACAEEMSGSMPR